MSESEVMVLLASIFFTFKFFINWYKPIFSNNPLKPNILPKLMLGILPLISFSIIWYTLRELASFDVVTDNVYIFFYLLLGFTWLFLCLQLVFFFFDLSFVDDVLNLSNKAAFATIMGGFLAITIIYSGANIGDGPGWWCVLIAGGLGLGAWIVLALFVHKYTLVFERITVERDLACGLRFGCYLLSCGIILGRASAGDWTSFGQTIVEFFVGWPALVVTLLAFLVEVFYLKKSKDVKNNTKNSLFFSLIWGVLYLMIAVASLTLYPLPENLIYDSEVLGVIGGAL